MRTREVVAVFKDAGFSRGRDIHKIHVLCHEGVQSLYMTTVDETVESSALSRESSRPPTVPACTSSSFSRQSKTCKISAGRTVDAMKSHIPPFCNGLPRIITQAANTAWQKIAWRDDPTAAAALFFPNPAATKMLVALHVLDPNVLIDLPAFQLERGENGVTLVDKNPPQSAQRNVTRLQAFAPPSHSVEFTYPLLYRFVR